MPYIVWCGRFLRRRRLVGVRAIKRPLGLFDMETIKMKKFTISARQLYLALGYRGNGFIGWWRGEAMRLKLLEDADFVVKEVSDLSIARVGSSDFMMSDEARARLLRSSRRKQAAPMIADLLINPKKVYTPVMVTNPDGEQVNKQNVAAQEEADQIAEMEVDLKKLEAGAAMSRTFETKKKSPFPPLFAAVPTPAAGAVVDSDTGDLIPRVIDGFVIPQRTKDGYVNATAIQSQSHRSYVGFGSTVCLVDPLFSRAVLDHCQNCARQTGIGSAALRVITRLGRRPFSRYQADVCQFLFCCCGRCLS